ncbi:hypothetical protein HYFRA_00002567 [Hymenoscyphus fraxineus]|uniref:Haloacid dehalogenase-like hydrolase n=1 Tax=Hymenoscyphus fraxineus TaxID=746836 RepID=A0A9N9Q0S0_9HELO|nr:hypothetical protein HYFRA_00002567 [Hymenoscyphus fraxineus]
MATSSPTRSFILDFDGTITTKDTISTLFQIALTNQSSKGNDKSQALQTILSEYSADFEIHISSYTPKKEDRVTLQQEIDYQRSLRDVEMRSFNRVSKSGIFAGLDEEEWYLRAGEAIEQGTVECRLGLRGFLSTIRGRRALFDDTVAKGRWGIVSVNFSANFIKGFLVGWLGDDMVEGNDLVECIEILANEPREEDGVLEGPMISGQREVIATSDGKLKAMRELLRRWKEDGGEIGQLFYFGDSGTDLECLTEADVGVILSDNQNGPLMDTMKRLKMEVSHIDDYKERDGNALYWAPDFKAIRSTIFG